MKHTIPFVISMMLITGASADTIGLSLRDKDAFVISLADNVEAAGKASGYQTIEADAKGDAGTQISDVNSLIKAGVSGLVVVSLNSKAEEEIVRLAKAANLPVVFVNRQPAAELLSKRAVYVGSDETVAGALQMQEVCRQLNGTGDIAILMGELSHPAAKARTLEVHKILGTPECKGISLLEEQSANWNREQALGVTQSWLEGGLKPNAILANNDEMALGAADAIKATGSAGILVAGVDATDVALSAVTAGDMAVTVLQDAAGQGRTAVETLVRLIRGETVDQIQYVPFQLVLPADVPRLVAARSQN